MTQDFQGVKEQVIMTITSNRSADSVKDMTLSSATGNICYISHFHIVNDKHSCVSTLKYTNKHTSSVYN